MTDDEISNKIMLYSQMITGALLVISELMGASSATKYNGIVHFIFACCHRKIYVDIQIEEEVDTYYSCESA